MFGNDPRYVDPYEQMMRSSFSAMLEDPFIMHRPQSMLQIQNGMNSRRLLPMHSVSPYGGLMGGMTSMNQMMMNMQRSMMGMHAMPMPSVSSGAHSFQSSTMVMTNDGSGPRVIQSSSSTRMGPDGVRETRRSHKDSGTGEMRMAIGHHINDRGHVVEKSKNRRTGDQEESQEYINIEEEEADSFNNEWMQKMSSSRHHRGLPHHQLGGRHDPYHRSHPRRRPHTAAITYRPPDDETTTENDTKPTGD